MKTVLDLVVESGNGKYHGRTNYDDDLLVTSAASLEQLQQKLKTILFTLHDLDPKSYEFKLGYDLTVFFERNNYLNLTKLADRVGINDTLLRQYAKGIKFPSEKQVQKLENAIREIGNELSTISLHARA